ncbi:MAG TPA: hypothetical protein VFA81_04550 [Burkholderiales bacterium]|nr:hypothetical protein [Burkholderiales bacterium]
MIRRDFLLMAGKTVSAAAFLPSLTAASAVSGPGVAHELASRSRYAALLNESFAVEIGSDVIPMRLRQIVDGASDSKTEQFSLVFEGPADRLVSADTYTLRHPSTGRFRLYLQPGRQDQPTPRYRADFALTA